ncbi:V-type ATP synthase subunit F [Streptomyces sp. MK7]|uniref:V-type ATP synthase subunit F n=1 Tax=Streptomyces sp. MK7 TaxID=3067635 RepID=UPI00292E94E9|nr:V-type ATP synthase subunit F [Streptomyces sp. MK7]
MGTVTAIGARTKVAGLALAGVEVHVAESPEAIHRAWRELAPTVSLVIVTAEAAEILRAEPTAATEAGPSRPLMVVMPR